MIAAALIGLMGVAIVCVVIRRRRRHTLHYRLKRVRLPGDWWEQFEGDFAAYVDPGAVRARDRERS